MSSRFSFLELEEIALFQLLLYDVVLVLINICVSRVQQIHK